MFSACAFLVWRNWCASPYIPTHATGQATPYGLTYTQPLTIPNRLFTSTLSNKRAVSTDLFEARGNQIGRKLGSVIWLGTKCGRTRGQASSSEYAHKKKRLRLYTFQFRSRSLLELPTSRKSRVRRQKVRFPVNPKYGFEHSRYPVGLKLSQAA